LTEAHAQALALVFKGRDLTSGSAGDDDDDDCGWGEDGGGGGSGDWMGGEGAGAGGRGQEGCGDDLAWWQSWEADVAEEEWAGAGGQGAGRSSAPTAADEEEELWHISMQVGQQYSSTVWSGVGLVFIVICGGLEVQTRLLQRDLLPGCTWVEGLDGCHTLGNGCVDTAMGGMTFGKAHSPCLRCHHKVIFSLKDVSKPGGHLPCIFIGQMMPDYHPPCSSM